MELEYETAKFQIMSGLKEERVYHQELTSMERIYTNAGTRGHAATAQSAMCGDVAQVFLDLERGIIDNDGLTKIVKEMQSANLHVHYRLLGDYR